MPGAIESFERVTCMLSDATKQHLGFSERLQQNHRSNSTLPLRFNINCQDQLCIHHSHRFFNHLGRLWSSSLSQGVAACRRRSWTRPSAMSKTSIPLASLCGSRHNSDEMDLGVLALCRLTKLPKLVVVNQQFKILHTSYTSYRIVEPDLSSNDLWVGGDIFLDKDPWDSVSMFRVSTSWVHWKPSCQQPKQHHTHRHLAHPAQRVELLLLDNSRARRDSPSVQRTWWLSASRLLKLHPNYSNKIQGFMETACVLWDVSLGPSSVPVVF